MEIGIVGAGRVGCSIGKYLKEHGAAVAGYYSKSRESVEFAAGGGSQHDLYHNAG